MPKEKKKKKGGKFKALWAEFKKFISKGNVLDMAVGVIIGGAFNTIVKSLVNILMSVVTWGVPGGIKGLITVLPAANETQRGLDGIGQYFSKADLNAKTLEFALNNGGVADLEVGSTAFFEWQKKLLTSYTLHGDQYTYNLSAVIDWGTFINAIISFLIIAATLFVILKVFAALNAKRDAMKAAALEKYYEAHPEERPAPPDPVKPQPTEQELLTAILEELKKQNAPALEAPPEQE